MKRILYLIVFSLSISGCHSLDIIKGESPRFTHTRATFDSLLIQYLLGKGITDDTAKHYIDSHPNLAKEYIDLETYSDKHLALLARIKNKLNSSNKETNFYVASSYPLPVYDKTTGAFPFIEKGESHKYQYNLEDDRYFNIGPIVIDGRTGYKNINLKIKSQNTWKWQVSPSSAKYHYDKNTNFQAVLYIKLHECTEKSTDHHNAKDLNCSATLKSVDVYNAKSNAFSTPLGAMTSQEEKA